jgi:hypothetical protein
VAAKTPITIPVNKALLGTWITNEEDSNVAFKFSKKSQGYRVTGFCRSDGEEFDITRVKWNGKALSFIARMPSTNYVTKNVFRIRQDGKLDFELTNYDVWKKKDVKPGRVPEAWRQRRATPHTKVRRARVVA